MLVHSNSDIAMRTHQVLVSQKYMEEAYFLPPNLLAKRSPLVSVTSQTIDLCGASSELQSTHRSSPQRREVTHCYGAEVLFALCSRRCGQLKLHANAPATDIHCRQPDVLTSSHELPSKHYRDRPLTATSLKKERRLDNFTFAWSQEVRSTQLPQTKQTWATKETRQQWKSSNNYEVMFSDEPPESPSPAPESPQNPLRRKRTLRELRKKFRSAPSLQAKADICLLAPPPPRSPFVSTRHDSQYESFFEEDSDDDDDDDDEGEEEVKKGATELFRRLFKKKFTRAG